MNSTLLLLDLLFPSVSPFLSSNSPHVNGWPLLIYSFSLPFSDSRTLLTPLPMPEWTLFYTKKKKERVRKKKKEGRKGKERRGEERKENKEKKRKERVITRWKQGTGMSRSPWALAWEEMFFEVIPEDCRTNFFWMKPKRAGLPKEWVQYGVTCLYSKHWTGWSQTGVSLRAQFHPCLQIEL